jgi:hypothetical protein
LISRGVRGGRSGRRDRHRTPGDGVVGRKGERDRISRGGGGIRNKGK